MLDQAQYERIRRLLPVLQNPNPQQGCNMSEGALKCCRFFDWMCASLGKNQKKRFMILQTFCAPADHQPFDNHLIFYYTQYVVKRYISNRHN